jgi:3-deoxy-manno-octulosonate cytidylyltransferase (CMP-KDO synthetase)
MDFSVIIPARYASSRLPAKLLKDINGKTLIEHTYSNAVKSDASRVIIATDDVRIKTIAEDFGAEVCMTNDSHISGTSRLSEVVSVLNFQDDDVVVNLQGDEPMMSPSAINQVASNLSSSGMSVATLCEKIDTEEAYFDENCVKVVYNSRGKAMYFSRSPIPAFRDSAKINLDLCFRHIGLYAYRVNFLKDYTNMAISSLEMAEKLEQLTFLTHGFDIHVETSCTSTGYGVDTESDLIKVKKELKNEYY